MSNSVSKPGNLHPASRLPSSSAQRPSSAVQSSSVASGPPRRPPLARVFEFAGRRWVSAAILLMAGVFAYSNSFQGQYVFDDRFSIPHNPSIERLWPLGPVLNPPPMMTVAGRPFLNFTFAVNYAVSRLEVWSYHAVNLAVHLVTALLLFGTVRRTLVSRSLAARYGAAATPLALSIALLWTVHPLQTESVTYLVQRAESLAALFYLLILYAAIRSLDGGARLGWTLLAFVAGVLGAATKEILVTVPAILVLYDRVFAYSTFRDQFRARWSLYAAVAVGVWITLAVVIPGARSEAVGLHFEETTPLAYLLTQSGVLLHYLRLCFWPHPLILDYHWPIVERWTEVAVPLFVVASLFLSSMVLLRTHPSVGFLGFAFFIFLSPTSSVVPIVTEVAAERRMYLPLALVLAGVVLAVFNAGRWLVGRGVLAPRAARVSGVVLLAVACAALTARTLVRNRDYRSPAAIWASVFVHHPHNFRAHSDLALWLDEAGNLPEAAAHYREALRLKPNDPPLLSNLGALLSRMQEYEEATRFLEEAVRAEPRHASFRVNLGIVLGKQGRTEEALGYLEEALRIDPAAVGAHVALAELHLEANRFGEARNHIEQALRLQPARTESLLILSRLLAETGREAEARQVLDQIAGSATSIDGRFQFAMQLAAQGRHREAVEQYRILLRHNVKNPDVYNNLGNALSALGQVEEAIAAFEEALRLNPDHAEAHNNLARDLATVGRMEDAFAHWDRALALRPGYAETHVNLGVALARSGRMAEAARHFREALANDPRNPMGYYNLGAALEALGETQDALGAYAEALRHKPDFVEARRNRAELFWQAGDPEQARAELQEALKHRPNWEEGKSMLRALSETQ